MDSIDQFFKAHMIAAPREHISIFALHAHYEAWARANGWRPIKMRSLAAFLADRRVDRRRDRDGWLYVNMRCTYPMPRPAAAQGLH